MKIHEYQAKRLLSDCGLAVPRGRAVTTVDEAIEAALTIGFPVVAKAQLLAGGRGKAGGVRRARDADELASVAGSLLGSRLTTAQTGGSGAVVRLLLIEEAVDLTDSHEMYLALLVDRARRQPIVMASQHGGMEIEEISARDPNALFTGVVDPAFGWRPHQSRGLALALALPQSRAEAVDRFVGGMWRAFSTLDAELIEVNPWLIMGSGKLLALDAKISLDDNALDRHPEHAALRDLAEEDALESEARRHGLSYIKIAGGTIGSLVNGAGLAMATMDLIDLAGGRPANFLDVGGGANVDQVKNAFRILLADADVRVVLINIFGGILRCDVLAQGVVDAARELDVRRPIVVRMKGNNEAVGRRILANSALRMIIVDDMAAAAARAVSEAESQR